MLNNFQRSDSESDEIVGSNEFGFSEKTIRHGFIRKVYSILFAQLLVTIIVISIFLFVEPIRKFSVENQWLYIVFMVITFICLLAFGCFPNVRRKVPLNMIFLGIFTLCESFMLGFVASHYQSQEVLMAVGITSAVALGLTLFAFQTKWDFTMCNGVIFVILIVLFFFGILCIFIRNRILNIFYASLGSLVFSIYLVIDTQMMMGGKHQYSLSPEEYIFAALNLYLDIINLFMFILSIIGQARSN